MSAVDVRHVLAVQAVLETLKDCPTAAHAALACEDAYIAFTTGIAMGINDPARCAQLNKEVVAELPTEEDKSKLD